MSNMNGIKRKEAPVKAGKEGKKQKTVHDKKSRRPDKAGAKGDSEGHERQNSRGFSAGVDSRVELESSREGVQIPATGSGEQGKFKLETSSAEAHAKQRALAKERKASKPHADAIERSKKIWEKLRRKSHVPKDERKALVAELFTIINGRVRDFVFKHDSVRVIQCALKYANSEQRRMIVDELKADVRPLVESRYGKFLVAKMVVEGDQEIRNIIVPQFYGHVKRLTNHPEASWIVDDIYRQVATAQQKATMLREWYGAEFALFHRQPDVKSPGAGAEEDTADLSEILRKNPEKRKPILEHVQQLINSLVQKKMTGFTMLHDAMLQYFLALTTDGEEQRDFLEMLKGDIDAETEGGGGDLYRNLAFTKSGSRLVCLALSYGSAKDRKVILRCFRDTIELMAYDQHAKHVLLAGLDVTDDTKMSGKTILSELLGLNIDDETRRLNRLEQIVTSLNARLPVLYPLAGMAKWLVNDQDKAVLQEVHQIRQSTSKKSPQDRRQDLLDLLSPPLLELISKRGTSLVSSTFGCQLVTETLLEANTAPRDEAKRAIAALAHGDPSADEHLSKNAAAGRMLKTLVLGGNFDPVTKSTKVLEPRLGFGADLYPVIQAHIVDWACGDSSFVIVGLLESEDVPASVKDDVRKALVEGRERIEVIAGNDQSNEKKTKKDEKTEGNRSNAGARILLEKMAR